MVPPLLFEAYHILKFILCEVGLSILYSYHVMLLCELRFQIELPIPQRLSVPHFLLQSIIEISQKVREGKHQHISHHGLIKCIVIDALNHLKNLVLWTYFVYVDRQVFIKTQTLISTQHEETPTSSNKGRE